MSEWSDRNILWSLLITVLGILCFPINPLVLFGVIDPPQYLPTYIIGWFVWGVGMVLVMAPMVMFPRHGGVKKGDSFVKTTQLVVTGVYGVVRHPQYLGGILALFITTALWYPHPLFIGLGVVGTVVIVMGCREEDQRLVGQFGEDYRAYMRRVPQLNLVRGCLRRYQRTRS